MRQSQRRHNRNRIHCKEEDMFFLLERIHTTQSTTITMLLEHHKCLMSCLFPPKNLALSHSLWICFYQGSWWFNETQKNKHKKNDMLLMFIHIKSTNPSIEKIYFLSIVSFFYAFILCHRWESPIFFPSYVEMIERLTNNFTYLFLCCANVQIIHKNKEFRIPFNTTAT